MTRQTPISVKITDAVVATFAFAAAATILVPVVLVAVAPFAG
jgi:hypothetical protein